ncbi:RNA polymerase sigma factor [Actinoplanes xinjiangensis]|uniref:RNA polymerase sigma factor (Sigma-70 family) n=1 Tax=Actinoplanes xinjiangensis TaxID=512350 RepID=A0A316F304_9ACTN|nr:RNA polymerase sigma factor [Actinoplanes xinjiangensis]PWK39470.1 RNA polymerase sigma factor (sigma-70 family) [Actinoplanes xinjiangensis]GIF42666.1 hypothetical protein Axi01nite_69770 [Actinoplanes xinjiangensis]
MEDPSAETGDHQADSAGSPMHRFQDLVGMTFDDAVEVIYRRARWLSKGDVPAAQELAQDSWQHIYELLSEGRLTEPIQSPTAWLRRLVQNVMLERIRRETAWKRGGQYTTESLDQRVEGGAEPQAEDEGPESLAVREDMSARLLAAVENLPEHLRSVTELILKGHTHKEIAELIGIPVNTSKTRLRAAVELLRGVGSLVAK